MRNLIAFIIKYQFLLLFLLIETLAIFLVIRFNQYQNSVFYNFSTTISEKVYSRTIHFKDYFKLRQINEMLVNENSKLYNELSYKEALLNTYSNLALDSIIDSTVSVQYRYISAKVINNSTNKMHNYITIDKGLNHGIKPDMGVISNNKLIGVVNSVSENYSIILSVLNPRLKISAKIKNTNYFGSLFWAGRNRTTCVLSEIPHHVNIAKGDSIVTSGYSAIFPENITIGYITDFRIQDGNFYEIKVHLAQDMTNLSNVLIIENFRREEQLNLEKENLDD